MPPDIGVKSTMRKLFLRHYKIFGLLVVLLGGCSSFHNVSMVSHGDDMAKESTESSPPSLAEENHPSFPVTKSDSSVPVVPQPSKPQTVPPPKGAAIAAQSAEDSILPRALEDVFFDYDQYTIRRDAVFVLEQNAKVLLNGYSTREILIEGHCDERGTEEYNLVLGERRATVVKNYLVDLGVPASNLHVLSLGKNEPFCLQPTLECFQQNRRAHFVMK